MRKIILFIMLSLIIISGYGQAVFAMEQLSGLQAKHQHLMELENGLIVIMAPLYTTTGNDPTLFETGFGGPLDGVGDLFLPLTNGNFRCTGSLLEETRLHVLTAAHCVTDDDGNFALLDGATITFEGDSADEVITINEAWSFAHPDYDGNFIRGNDIAILELDFAPTSDITGYEIDRNPADDIGSMPVQTGYGRTGTGLLGHFIASGIKHDVLNTFDSDADDFNENLLGETPGVTTIADSVLLTDFDDTNAESGGVIDACAIWNGNGFGFVCPADVGKGVDEGTSALGDSGGPSFTSAGPNTITGITSYGITFVMTPGQSDINNFLDSSYGEFAGYTRVAIFEDWIDQVLADSMAEKPTIGGTGMQIDTTVLLLATVQSVTLWMIPVIAGIVVGVFVIRKRV